MTELLKFNTMYDKGVIQNATEFPPISERQNGMVFTLWSDNRIGDPYVYTEKESINQSVSSIITNTGHRDEESSGYKKITGVGSYFNTNLTVGCRIIVNGEIRYVESIDSDLVIKLNKPLESLITIDEAIVIYSYVKTEEEFRKIYVDENHSTNAKIYVYNYDLNNINYNSFSFLDYVVSGAELIIITNNTAYKRIIKNIISDTELELNSPLAGDLTDITGNINSIQFIMSKNPHIFDNVVIENINKNIVWSETPTGYGWSLMSNDDISTPDNNNIILNVKYDIEVTTTGGEIVLDSIILDNPYYDYIDKTIFDRFEIGVWWYKTDETSYAIPKYAIVKIEALDSDNNVISTYYKKDLYGVAKTSYTHGIGINQFNLISSPKFRLTITMPQAVSENYILSHIMVQITTSKKPTPNPSMLKTSGLIDGYFYLKTVYPDVPGYPGYEQSTKETFRIYTQSQKEEAIIAPDNNRNHVTDIVDATTYDFCSPEELIENKVWESATRIRQYLKITPEYSFVPTTTLLTFANAIPVNGDTVKFGSLVFEFVTDAETTPAVVDAIAIPLTGVTTVTKTAEALVATFNSLTVEFLVYSFGYIEKEDAPYNVFTKSSAGVVTLTATKYFEEHNDITTTTDFTTSANAIFEDVTFGGGTGSSVEGINPSESTIHFVLGLIREEKKPAMMSPPFPWNYSEPKSFDTE